jgi:hypothetical protein
MAFPSFQQRVRTVGSGVAHKTESTRREEVFGERHCASYVQLKFPGGARTDALGLKLAHIVS